MTAEFWQYDARLGRRLNKDQIVKHWESSYATFSDNPILYADPKGLDSTSRAKKYAKENGGTVNKTDKGHEVERSGKDGDAFEKTITKFDGSIKEDVKEVTGKIIAKIGRGWEKHVDKPLRDAGQKEYDGAFLEGQTGFDTYVGEIDNTGEAIETAGKMIDIVPVAGKFLSKPIQEIGGGLGVAADLMNSVADFEQKGFNQGFKNFKIRLCFYGLGEYGVNKLGGTGHKLLDNSSKSLLNFSGERLKDAMIQQSNDEYYGAPSKK